MSAVRIATLWLDGCSGCHMSLLDMDERLLDLIPRIELVYSPLVDFKEFPENVDVTFVEGAVGNKDHLEQIQLIRDRTSTLVSFGDCAVTANIPGMRNKLKAQDVLAHSYGEHADEMFSMEGQIPLILDKALPIHEIVKVDLFIPGCPPPAEIIFQALSELVNGSMPHIEGKSRFGA